MGESLKNYFSQNMTFHGRIGRKQYLLQSLGALLALGLGIFLLVLGVEYGALLYLVGGLLLLLGWAWTWCLSVRRLHDLGKSGWYLLGIGLLEAILKNSEILGSLVSLIFFGLMVGVRGTRGPNRFGPDPLAGEVTDPWHRNAPNPRN
ncbi:DUF805 domain-containing protein [Acidaminococcus sp. NSJ-142]|jgi:uncharacterized membrane protein YhaH (DUF805 family)|nr:MULTISPECIES: DUF805 domain-containing protein [Acidaminococcus]MCD2435840.1 DUF805 domain-containing protein [Acidaminococcus hominis]MCH4095635.1 DUF805 domain-containing protein [Acidaminococcus provencensis]